MFKTVAYADIFDFPLTKEEIKKWWIAEESDPAGFKSPIGSDPNVQRTGIYYYLRGRSHLVELRKRRLLFSQARWRLARRAAKILRLIPWVKLVCVTGALAMDNSGQDDDIDLMVVTAKNRLWLTRLLVLLLFFPWIRRFPTGSDLEVSRSPKRPDPNVFCLNLWLDETALVIKARNLYTAHEICQAKPIFERGNTYKKFIMANLWYKKYLPSWKI